MFSLFLAGRPNGQLSKLPAIDAPANHDRRLSGDQLKAVLLQQPAPSPADVAKVGLHIELLGEATT